MAEKFRHLSEAVNDHLIIGGPDTRVPPSPPQPAPALTLIADSPCPCCEKLTIPNGGDALAYICPECLWEIDLFLTSDDEPSDQNHGLTLNQAREHYRACGVCWPKLKSQRSKRIAGSPA